jgi:hypothetical protein
MAAFQFLLAGSHRSVGYTEVAEGSAGQVLGVKVASDGLRQQGRPCAHI